jgi:hypothetical protein
MHVAVTAIRCERGIRAATSCVMQTNKGCVVAAVSLFRYRQFIFERLPPKEALLLCTALHSP